MHASEPIDRVIEDPHTSPSCARGSSSCARRAPSPATPSGLPQNKSYTSYADIERPYVVWNVVATPEFSVTPHHWCFPVAGCVAYRGYFHEQAAREFAAAAAPPGL